MTIKERLDKATAILKTGIQKAFEWTADHKEVFYYIGGFLIGEFAERHFGDNKPAIDTAKKMTGAGADTMCNVIFDADKVRPLREIVSNADEKFPGYGGDDVVGITFHTRKAGDDK